MTSPRTLLVDNHDSYSYNLGHLIAGVTGSEPDVVEVDHLTLMQAWSYDAVVISPGPGHPATEPAFATCLDLLRSGKVPVLGVCLGHQGIAVAFGGLVEKRPPAHGVVSPVRHDGQGLYVGMSSPFRAVRYHSLCVTEVPDCLVVDSWTDDGTVMGLRHAMLPIAGVQFHPESILSEGGARLILNFFTFAELGTTKAVDTPSTTGATSQNLSRAETPVVRRWKGWLEPAEVAERLLGGERRSFWLDSSRMTAWSGRWSYLGWLDEADESITTRMREGGSTGHAAGANTAVDAGMFDLLGERVGTGAPSIYSSGVPFVGGWVGYLGYASGDIPARPAEDAVPDACFLHARRLLAFDHRDHVVYLVAPDDASANSFAADVTTRLDSAPIDRGRGADYPTPTIDRPTLDSYVDRFAEIRRELHEGNTYEALLAHTVRIKADVNPLALYLRLRELNPAPYSAFLRHDEVWVLSTSPERFLSAGPDDTLETRPIKGTTPRGATVQEDALHRWWLRQEAKFLAENLMIADLLRNDLSRVCLPGTVQVTELMAVESYASVHQLVTTITGRRRPDFGIVDCVRSLFPGGSMTGAPKVRTMQIIDRVEDEPRGVYAGALGWFGDNGGCDLSIIIRTLVGSGSVWTLGVGGGIVVSSNALDEYEETEWKANRLLQAMLSEATAWTQS